MTKPTKWSVGQARTQICLGIRQVGSESSLSAWRNLGPLATQRAHSEDWSDWKDVSSLGAHAILLVLSCGGSFNDFFTSVSQQYNIEEVGVDCISDKLKDFIKHKLPQDVRFQTPQITLAFVQKQPFVKKSLDISKATELDGLDAKFLSCIPRISPWAISVHNLYRWPISWN